MAGRAALRVSKGGLEIEVVTTDATLAEVEEYLPKIADKCGLAEAQLTRLLAELSLVVYGAPAYEQRRREATERS